MRVAITFDDGYSDFWDLAVPALDALQVPVTLFACMAEIGETIRDNDLGCVKHLDSQQLIDIDRRPNVAVELHGYHHVPLAPLAAEDQRRELALGARNYQSLLGRLPQHFCYPYGSMNRALGHLIAAEGLISACSTISGVNVEPFDRYRIRRVAVESTWSAAQLRQVYAAAARCE